MIYLEHIPASPLGRFVDKLWYAQAPRIAHRRERILPSGCVQLILNLARDFLLDCAEVDPLQAIRTTRMAPALIVGGRSVYEIVDSSDMTDLIGVQFRPSGFAAFVPDRTDLFSNRSTGLEAVWGGRAQMLREQLLEAATPQSRFRLLEQFLSERHVENAGIAGSRAFQAVGFALERFRLAPSVSTVRTVAANVGWSERRFSEVFREHVGHSPKVWCRIQRFQRAVGLLHRGADVPWADLALDCGFYDQSHFANEFRAFSGVDATTYSAQRTLWANHIRVD